MNFFLHSRRGQTLVEALVALSILTTGFIGIVALLTKSFQLNRTTTNDTQATYLAAEGIELVKNLSDHDVYAGLAQGTSTDNFGACFYNGSGYYSPIDYKTIDCSKLHFSTAPPDTSLYFDPTTDLFSADSLGGTATNFVRNIKVTDETDPLNSNTLVDLDVQSAVTWSDGGISNTITLEDHFYNWHP